MLCPAKGRGDFHEDIPLAEITGLPVASKRCDDSSLIPLQGSVRTTRLLVVLILCLPFAAGGSCKNFPFVQGKKLVRSEKALGMARRTGPFPRNPTGKEGAFGCAWCRIVV